MNLRTVPLLLLLAIFVAGCGSDDTSATGSNAPKAKTSGTAKMGGDAAKVPTPDAAKPADDSSAAAPAAGANSMVGTWTADDKEIKNEEVEFRADGTATLKGEAADAKGMSMEANANYKVEGDKVTLTMTSMKLTAMPDADAKTKKAIADSNKMMTPEYMKKQPPSVGTVVWKDKDTFTATDDNGPKKGKVTTFKRKA